MMGYIGRFKNHHHHNKKYHLLSIEKFLKYLWYEFLVGMKIAFIYDAIYPWIKGGAEKRIYGAVSV